MRQPASGTAYSYRKDNDPEEIKTQPDTLHGSGYCKYDCPEKIQDVDNLILHGKDILYIKFFLLLRDGK